MQKKKRKEGEAQFVFAEFWCSESNVYDIPIFFSELNPIGPFPNR